MTPKSAKIEQETNPAGAGNGWILVLLADVAENGSKTQFDYLGMDDAPDWVHTAWAELCKVLFPAGLPDDSEKWDANFLGSLLGRLEGLHRAFNGEVPLGPQAQAEMEQLTAWVEKQSLPPNIDVIAADLGTKISTIQAAIPAATSGALSAGYQESKAFQKALARGIDIKPDELATCNIVDKNSRVLLLLIWCWRHWAGYQSLGQVHRKLGEILGAQRTPEFKAFEKLCQKIGFRLRGRGRPPGSKNSEK